MKILTAASTAATADFNTDFQISEIEKIGRFIFGGNAIFTLQNKETGTHFTYRVKCKKSPGRVVFFVSVLTGPNNTADYSYAGYCTSDKAVQIWTKKDARTFTDAAPSVKAFNWLLARLAYCKAQNKPFPTFAGFYHMGSCCVCNRPLTDPLSIELGIGPICRAN